MASKMPISNVHLQRALCDFAVDQEVTQKVTIREISYVSIGAPHTRKSLVKGERFIRSV